MMKKSLFPKIMKKSLFKNYVKNHSFSRKYLKSSHSLFNKNTPFSVITPLIKSHGTISNAGLITSVPSGQILQFP